MKPCFSLADIDELTGNFGSLTAKVPLHPITDAFEYEKATRATDGLLDAGAADDAHPLARLVSALGELVTAMGQRQWGQVDAGRFAV